MAKNALVFSPLFFGLLFLVLIAFNSEGGGVSGQYCNPYGGTNVFAGKIVNDCSGCGAFCTSLPVPVTYTKPNSGVKSWSCMNYAPSYAAPVIACRCCVD
ncbi:hypothetical protein MKW94_018339 [Papaver nudicaule]|uniref:Uncharacterized protein n=1 Tax=Papaver nudicaule TaxID=74823 RepID=A0AA41S488_PAPNU|nr:hypothetical protein [Papaver nudicaule]